MRRFVAVSPIVSLVLLFVNCSEGHYIKVNKDRSVNIDYGNFKYSGPLSDYQHLQSKQEDTDFLIDSKGAVTIRKERDFSEENLLIDSISAINFKSTLKNINSLNLKGKQINTFPGAEIFALDRDFTFLKRTILGTEVYGKEGLEEYQKYRQNLADMKKSSDQKVEKRADRRNRVLIGRNGKIFANSTNYSGEAPDLCMSDTALFISEKISGELNNIKVGENAVLKSKNAGNLRVGRKEVKGTCDIPGVKVNPENSKNGARRTEPLFKASELETVTMPKEKNPLSQSNRAADALQWSGFRAQLDTQEKKNMIRFIRHYTKNIMDELDFLPDNLRIDDLEKATDHCIQILYNLCKCRELDTGKHIRMNSGVKYKEATEHLKYILQNDGLTEHVESLVLTPTDFKKMEAFLSKKLETSLQKLGQSRQEQLLNKLSFPSEKGKNDTVGASITVHNKDQKKRICILNFGNSNQAGGGFLNGKTAQEECLSRQTTIYPGLTLPHVLQNYHDHNKNGEGKGDFGTSEVVLTKNVSIVRYHNEEKRKDPNFVAQLLKRPIPASTITAAFPNLDPKRKYKEDGAYFTRVNNPALIDLWVYKVIKNIILTAAANEDQILLLGALGCGVYDHDPVVVASIFKKILIEEGFAALFEEIVFPITNQNLRNTFEGVLRGSIPPRYYGSSKGSEGYFDSILTDHDKQSDPASFSQVRSSPVPTNKMESMAQRIEMIRFEGIDPGITNQNLASVNPDEEQWLGKQIEAWRDILLRKERFEAEILANHTKDLGSFQKLVQQSSTIKGKKEKINLFSKYNESKLTNQDTSQLEQIVLPKFITKLEKLLKMGKYKNTKVNLPTDPRYKKSTRALLVWLQNNIYDKEEKIAKYRLDKGQSSATAEDVDTEVNKAIFE